MMGVRGSVSRDRKPQTWVSDPPAGKKNKKKKFRAALRSELTHSAEVYLCL